MCNKCRYLETERRCLEIPDTRVHVLLYFISPHGRGLKPLDVEVMKKLASKVNLVPVIAKADTLTKAETNNLKAMAMKVLGAEDIGIYLPEVQGQEMAALGRSLPFAVCGANALEESEGVRVRVRQYPWGNVEVENPDHSDFGQLMQFLGNNVQDLKEVTNLYYETFRQWVELHPFQREAEAMKKRRESNSTNFNNNFV